MRFRYFGLAAFAAAVSLSVPVTTGSLATGLRHRVPPASRPAARTILTAAPRDPRGASGPSRAIQRAIGATSAPTAIGNQIAGTFDDATGHSSQSHLIFAANSRVWWLFTLTSSGDAQGGSNHIVKAFRSSGPDLTTATWIAAADSPPAAAGSPNAFLGGGRSLGVAYINNAPLDIVHADISMAFDGQNGRTGHIRAIVSGTAISWQPWQYFDEPAATWTLPHGNAVGVSTGKFIHTGGAILQQEVDANARRSTTPDTGSAWVSGFSQPAVIDGTMLNQSNVIAFAPLAADAMLAVYDNGVGSEPSLTNLRYKRSNPSGSWITTVVGAQTGGDGNVFPTSATINQNDWALVPVSPGQAYAFRRRSAGNGLDAVAYDAASNSFVSVAAPPPLGPGQSVKAGAGVFGASDGTSVWVCVINKDASSSILWTRFDGSAWTPWAVVPGTDVGIQDRNYLSGSPKLGNGLVGLIWTEGASAFDIGATTFVAAPDTEPPTVSITSPADGASVKGTVPVTATAADNVAVAGVQFRVDGAPLDVEIASPPYTVSWNSAATTSGTHTLTATARDDAGNTTTSSGVVVTAANPVTPTITWPTPAKIAAGTPLGATQLNAVANTAGTFTYTPPAGTVLGVGLNQPLAALFAPADAKTFTTATANNTIDVVVLVPNVVGATPAAAADAIVAAALTLGAVTESSSSTVAAGLVISQTPAAGTELTKPSSVDLVVSSGSPQIPVPSVVGLTQAAATAAITGVKLTVGIVSTSSSTSVPSGTVISQSPAAAAQVSVGSAVALVVSSGPPQVAVPNVVGLPQAAATAAIAAANLTVGAITTSASTVPAGSVITQSPAAAMQVNVGTAIALVISSGPPQVAVPNVVGLPQAAATAAIAAANLTVAVVTTSASATVPSGTVISQSPAAATQVNIGTAVGLIVSSGPPQVAVPNVVGLPQAAAALAVAGANLTVGAITTSPSITVPSGVVLNQSPAAATQVSVGSAVALVVSSGPAQVGVPSLIGLPQAAATALITAAGLTVGTVTTGPSTMPAGLVINQSPDAGTPALTGTAVSLVVSSGPPPATPGVISIDMSVSIDGTGTVTTPPFSTSEPNELLVVFASSAGPTAVSLKQTLAISGGGLTWTLATRTNAQFGSSEVWTAYAAAPLTNAAIASVQSMPNAYHQSLTLIAFKGAAGTGAIGNASASFGPTAVSLTTTRAGSLVYAVANDSARAAARIYTPDQTMVHQWVDVAGANTFWVQTLASAAGPTGTTITINDPVPTSDRWNAAAIEILAGDTAASPVVPDVVGLSETAAVDALTAAGLVAGTISTETSTLDASTVLSESPLAGSQVTKGSAVALVVSSGPAPVTVPDVVGSTQSAASDAITSANLTIGAITQSSSGSVPAGSIVSQAPPAGTQIAPHSAVALVVSSGPPPVAVPNVVGLTQAAASAALAAANLTGTITTATSILVPSGAVISQNPGAATQVAPGSAVVLIVSSGPPQVAVPDVVGQPQTVAGAAIAAAGLIVGVVTPTASATVAAGSVIAETPAAGTTAPIGSAIDLSVSTGPPMVNVPDVTSMSQADATTALANAGLAVGAVTFTTSTAVPSGAVASQLPSAGTPIVAGSTVSLVVSLGPPPGAPVVDASVSVDGIGRVTTAPFSTSGTNELLVAFVASDGGAAAQSALVSGAGLTWTLVRRANAVTGTAEVWTATATAPLANVVVTAAQTTATTSHQSLTVMAFTGTAGIGFAGAASDTRSAPSVSLLTTSTSSLVFGVGMDPDRPTARTLPTGQALVHQWVDKDANATFWVQAVTDPLTLGTFATISDPLPNKDHWNVVTVEIQSADVATLLQRR